MIGYINNKKGFVVTTDDTYQTAYVVGSNLGGKLEIKILRKNTNSINYTDLGSIFPVIPFRLMYCDNPRGSISRACQKTDADTTIKLFNPGLDFDGTYITGLPDNLHSSYYGSKTFVEVNLTVEQIERFFTGSDAVYMQNQGTALYYKPKSLISTTIESVSLCALPTTTTTDRLVISVVTKVTFTLGGPTESLKTFDGTVISYTLPFILVYDIDKTQTFSNTKVYPRTWTYGIPFSELYARRLNAVNIIYPNEPGTSVTTKHWNYNFISGTKVTAIVTASGTKVTQYFYMPGDLGSLVDFSTNGLDGFITCAYSKCDDSKNWTTQVANYYIANFMDDIKTGYQYDAGHLFKSRTFEKNVAPVSISSSRNVDEFGNNFYISCVTLSVGKTGVIPIKPTTFSYLMTRGNYFNLYGAVRIDNTWNLDADAYARSFAISMVDKDDGTLRVYSCGSLSTLIPRIQACSDTISGPQFAQKCSLTKLAEKSGFETSSGSKAISPELIYGFDTMVATLGAVQNSKLYTTLGYKNFIYINTLYESEIIVNILKSNFEGFTSFSINNSNRFNNSVNQFAVSAVPNILLGEIGSLHYNILKTDLKSDVITVKENKNAQLYIGNYAYFVYHSTTGVDPAAGIDFLLQIDNCSGVYSLGEWNADLNGIAIDYEKTRDDFKFKHDGRKDTFDTAGEGGIGGYGYWANITSPKPQLVLSHANPNFKSELRGMSYSNYDTNGSGKIQAGIRLFLNDVKDGSNLSYNEEGYSLTDITASLTFPFPDPVKKTITGISLTPPSAAITVSKTPTTYKDTNPSSSWSITKSNGLSKVNSLSFIEVVNGKPQPRNLYDWMTDINVPSFSSTTKNISFSGAKGDYFLIKWEELLNSRQFSKSTNYVSYVSGHRYIINKPSLVKIYLNSVDKTSAIFSQSEFLYVDVTGSPIDLKVSYDFAHEDFSAKVHTDYPIPNDSSRYPVISAIHLMVVPKQTWPSIENGINYQAVVPEGSPNTYPNSTDGFYNKIYSLANDASIGFIGTDTFLGSSITATGDITVSIDKSNTYQIFLAVVDEFNQTSVFHITSANKISTNKTYRTEFGAGV